MYAQIAQLVEHPLGKGKVKDSSSFLGSKYYMNARYTGENGELMQEFILCPIAAAKGRRVNIGAYTGDGGGMIIHCEAHGNGGCKVVGECQSRIKPRGGLVVEARF